MMYAPRQGGQRCATAEAGARLYTPVLLFVNAQAWKFGCQIPEQSSSMEMKHEGLRKSSPSLKAARIPLGDFGQTATRRLIGLIS
jgi:hypothetical protein